MTARFRALTVVETAVTPQAPVLEREDEMLNHTRTILLTALVALLASAPVASAQTTHKYSSTTMIAPVSTANGYPNPGGYAVFTGTVLTKPFGPGSVVDTVVVTGQSAPNVLTLAGSEVAYFGDGTVRDTFTGTTTIQSDGSQAVAVKGRVTRGSGHYTGATGSYTFSGTTAPGSNVTTGTSSGSIVF
jgi:hypothetical protein